MKLRDKIIQDLYEIMTNEKIHEEVDKAFDGVTDQFNLDEHSKQYDDMMNALYDLEHAAFCAGANMILDFISGKEV